MKILFLFLLLLPSVSFSDCTGLLTPHLQPIYNFDVKVLKTGVQIPNGWSHLTEVEVLNAPSDQKYIVPGQHLLVLWTRFFDLPLPKEGLTYLKIGIEKDDFFPNFEPKNYYNLWQPVETVPRIKTYADWEHLSTECRDLIVTGYRDRFLEQLEIVRKKWDGENILNAAPIPAELAQKLNDFVRENISLDVHDGLPHATVGAIQYRVELTQLKSTQQVVGLRLRIFQDGAENLHTQNTHYANKQAAINDGASVDADINWSTSVTFEVTKSGNLKHVGRIRPLN